jgi:hypothetical protein
MWGGGNGSVYGVLMEYIRKTSDLEDMGVDERI